MVDHVDEVSGLECTESLHRPRLRPNTSCGDRAITKSRKVTDAGQFVVTRRTAEYIMHRRDLACDLTLNCQKSNVAFL